MKIYFIYLLALSLTFSVKAQTQSDVIENALSSVVTVVVYKTTDVNTVLGMRGAVDEKVSSAYKRALDLSGAEGSGSGFVIGMNGKKYIITNAHVVENAAPENGSIYIYSISQKKYEVKVVGGDTFYDIAVLELLENPGPEISTIELARANPRVGEKVFAIGNPLGDFPYSVSDGIISAKNRARDGLTGKFGFLQTTATLIWGNSGGPLVNANGEVVGINSQIEFTNGPDGNLMWQSQINFALEVELARRLIEEVVNNNGRVTRSYYGMVVSEDYGVDYYGVAEKGSHPRLSGLVPNSPAYKQLKNYIDQKIISVNGFEVRNINELLGVLEMEKPGKSTSLEFEGGDKISLAGIELDDTKLTDIAHYAIASDESIELDENATGVFLYYNRPEALISENRQGYKTKTNKSAGFQIIAAGLAEENTQIMYRIESLTDLGAALRLTSLVGVFDFYGYASEYAEPQLIRHMFSDESSVIRKTLYY